MAWRSMGGTARNYVNTDTGEIISRRQYDKHFGRLKDSPISQDKIAQYRKEAGIPKNVKNLPITFGVKYDASGRRHVTVQTTVSKAADTVARLAGLKSIQKHANVSVKVKTKQGWRQSRAFHPTHHSDIGGAIAGAAADLNSIYGEDDDAAPDPEIELDWGYSE